MKNKSILLTTVLAMALGLATLAGGPPPDKGPDQDGPKKVWVCHFDGHDAGETWGQFDLDGDYVVAYTEGMPLANQIEYCETGNEGASVAGELILISVNALDGHGVQLQERVADYPDGYKG